jgi:beta-galactosidase GanA
VADGQRIRLPRHGAELFRRRARAFRDWLAQRYQSTDALNRAWGNVFWSMEYDSFDQIDLPNLTVTEPNPAHALDFRRFSSDQVAAVQRGPGGGDPRALGRADLAQLHGPGARLRPFRLGAQMEIATWDSYPLGFLEDRLEDPPEHKRRYARQGDPDFQAFHHDLYRAVGRGRWWVMEQQPGPVNWARTTPRRCPAWCGFWTWEAFAHGAECVSYFRWRQAPFAQEQYHAGLLRPDSAEAPAFGRGAAGGARTGRIAGGGGGARAGRAGLRLRLRLGLGGAAAGRGMRLFPAGLRGLSRAAETWPVGRYPAAGHCRSWRLPHGAGPRPRDAVVRAAERHRADGRRR